VLSTGYNASVSGHPHCDEAGHIIIDNSCVRAAHAEENAVVTAARFGISVADTTAYTTHFPCWRCFRMLANAGVRRIVYLNFKFSNLTPEIFVEYLSSKIMIEDAEGSTLADLKDSILEKITKQ
jgi:deoxycytidylate deaminase